MKIKLLLLTALLTLGSTKASDNDDPQQAATNYLQLRILTAAATFGLVYLICKKCFGNEQVPVTTPALPAVASTVTTPASRAKNTSTVTTQRKFSEIEQEQHAKKDKNTARFAPWHAEYDNQEETSREKKIRFKNQDQIKEIPPRTEQTDAEKRLACTKELERTAFKALGIK
jgi:hypothetical protein